MSVPPVPDIGPPWGPAVEVPDWLRPALEAVLRDLQRPTPLELAIGWTEGKGDVAYAGMLWVVVLQPELVVRASTIGQRALSIASGAQSWS